MLAWSVVRNSVGVQRKGMEAPRGSKARRDLKNKMLCTSPTPCVFSAVESYVYVSA